MPSSNYRGKKTLKFPILKDVEYVSVFKDRQSVLEIDGSEIEGLSWRELQLFLGKSLQPSLYQYTMKFKKSNEIHSGRIRATSMGKQIINPVDNNQSDIIKEFKTLKDQLAKATNTGGISFEMLLASTKQAYEAQISFKDQIISNKDELIRELKESNNDLEDDLDECQKQTAGNDKTAFYLDLAQKYLNTKFGKVEAVSLKESDPSDIPEAILKVLGTVDYSKIDEANMNKIIIGLRQYISFLPLKGQ